MRPQNKQEKGSIVKKIYLKKKVTPLENSSLMKNKTPRNPKRRTNEANARPTPREHKREPLGSRKESICKRSRNEDVLITASGTSRGVRLGDEEIRRVSVIKKRDIIKEITSRPAKEKGKGGFKEERGWAESERQRLRKSNGSNRIKRKGE